MSSMNASKSGLLIHCPHRALHAVPPSPASKFFYSLTFTTSSPSPPTTACERGVADGGGDSGDGGDGVDGVGVKSRMGVIFSNQ